MPEEGTCWHLGHHSAKKYQKKVKYKLCKMQNTFKKIFVKKITTIYNTYKYYCFNRASFLKFN